MGEILLVTTIVLLAAVIYYVNKNEKSNNKKSIYNSPYFNKNQDFLNNQDSNNPNFDSINQNNSNNTIINRDNQFIYNNYHTKNHLHNSISRLNDDNNDNSTNFNNSNPLNPITFQNFTKCKIINQIFTPNKEDNDFTKNNRNNIVNELTSELCKHELINKNHKRNHEFDDVSKNLTLKKRKRRYSDDSFDQRETKILHDLTNSHHKNFYTYYINYFFNIKYFKKQFYRDVLISLIQRIIEYMNNFIKRYGFGIDINKNSESNYKICRIEKINGVSSSDENNKHNISRNLLKSNFEIGDSNYNNLTNNNLINNFNQNLLSIKENPQEDLKEYILKNHEKKLKVRDLIFSDYNTYENYTYNKGLNNVSNLFPSFNNFGEKIYQFPNTVREYQLEKKHPNHFDEDHVEISDNRLVYLGKTDGIKTFYLNHLDYSSWNEDSSDSNRKSPKDKNNFFNLLDDNQDIFNKNKNIINKFERRDSDINNKLKKIDKNDDLDNKLNNNKSYYLNKIAPVIDLKNSTSEKKESNTKTDLLNNNLTNKKKLCKTDNIDSNHAKESNIFNLRSNPCDEKRLLKEFTPKNNKKIINEKKLSEHDTQTILNYSKNLNDLYEFKSHANTHIYKKESMMEVLKKKDLNVEENNIYEQTETLFHNNFTDFPNSQKILITQAKLCDNNILTTIDKDAEMISTKSENRYLLKSSILKKKYDEFNDQNEILEYKNSKLISEEGKKKNMNGDKISSPMINDKLIPTINKNLPSSIKRNDINDTNHLFLSSENNYIIDIKKENRNSSEKFFLHNLKNESNKKFAPSSNYKTTPFDIKNKRDSKNKMEASNYRKKSNKKMTFAPSDCKDFSDLIYNTNEKKVASLIPEETESFLTRNNLINTPSINNNEFKDHSNPTAIN